MPSFKVAEVIDHYQRKMQRHPNEPEVLRHALSKLSKLSGVSISVLQSTGIGRTVNGLKKSEDDNVAALAKELVAKWKEIVANEEEAGEEEEEEPPQHQQQEQQEEPETEEQEVAEALEEEEREEEPPRLEKEVPVVVKEDKKDHHSSSSSKHHKSKKSKRSHHEREKEVEESSSPGKSKKSKKSKKSSSSSTSSSHHHRDRDRDHSKASGSSHKSSNSDNSKPKSKSKPSTSSATSTTSNGHHSTPLVPEGISPNYKPLPPKKSSDLANGHGWRPKSMETSDEALSALLAKAKGGARTAVYSGAKRTGYFGQIPSLHQMCVHVLQENVESIEECGGLPFDILEPILERSSPDNLLKIEDINPYLMEDTGKIWERFVKKHFPKAEREEMESYREMFERCTIEREEKLNRLKVKVKDSYQREKSDVKMAKLAYVGLNAKPPQNVMRAQARNGTALPVGQPINVGRPRPGIANMPGPSGPPKKPKVAPMMAKTLKMARSFKTGFRR